MRVFKYFFDFVDGQEHWLNKMSQKGYRLVKCGKLIYEFEKCTPNKYEYAVELVGQMSEQKRREYQDLFKELEYKVFTKNLNLNFSIGKIRYRPWGIGSGQITTSPGSYNKELLIVETPKTEKKIQIHSDLEDKLLAYQNVINALLYAIIAMIVLIVVSFVYNKQVIVEVLWVIRVILIVFAVMWIVPLVKLTLKKSRLKGESKISER
ncbi:DUF2812 domain-containing protein [Sedimentibacter sp. MB31-C6]|uniref:DUF2812 domain-containing protein n=1 Tax=Sedimentibacter sp. MB31-C6 TaxID=3109366 RepID=UPI002DDD7E24|nr:DUF2812 domain-containing protein [Sedimentibacter sp. MB36-C1]WSI04566.1 DUF2812 domain-containing protein [Sedimentibacter sp. MB36-C1]